MGKLKVYKILSGVFSILSIISIGLCIYSLYLLTGIETFYRIMFSLLLILFDVALVYSLIESVKFFKKKKFIISSIITVILSIVACVISIVILLVYNKIDSMNTEEYMYSTSLVATKELGSIKELKDITIGIIENEEDIEGNILPNKAIKEYKLDSKNEIVKYSDTITLMGALISGEVDSIFVRSDYESMFDKLENLPEDIKFYEITKYEKPYKKSEVEKTDNEVIKTDITKPFTILLLGVDSQEDGMISGSFNGDTIMLVTFNPETLNATMFSIPRDTYVPMACGGNTTKITHAAWGGTNCMVKTVENFTGIKIDYYVKINFKGVVNLVDKLGGITVDVPKAFCESNSNRWQGEWEICLEKGVQRLNGEQALAFARHRKTLPLGDFQRGQNQQLVVEGMLNELRNIKDVKAFYDLLDIVSKNMDTSMTTDEILSFYNIGKNIILKDEDATINITKTFLTGYDLTIYEGYNYTYTFQYYKQSLNSIVDAMKENLGLKEKEEIKSFSFNINEPYEKTIIGQKYYSEARKQLVPNFASYTLAEAQAWASSHGFSITVNEVSSGGANGEIIAQSVHDGVLVEKANKNIVLTVVKTTSTQTPPKEDDEEDDNKPTKPSEDEKPKEDEDTGNESGGTETEKPTEPETEEKPEPEDPPIPGVPEEGDGGSEDNSGE